MERKEKFIENDKRFESFLNLIKSESTDELKDIIHKYSYLLKMKDRNGRTCLHYCSELSSALSAELLLEKVPDLLTAQDNDGYTALHLSVISGNQIMTRYLIGKCDENYINLCDNECHTGIHWAVVCGELQCLDLLLNSGAHPSRADIHGAYPLHYAAQMCSPHSGICIGNDYRLGLTLLNRLLQSPDIDVNCVDSDNRTPLLWAASAELRESKINCSSGSGDALLALVNAGANVSAKDKDGLTALHCASSRGHIDCAETLLNLCNADVNQMDSNGCPPLFYAVTLGHADCTRLLIESGADVNQQDFKGRTAAHCGAARGQFETIKILGQLGANLWLRNIRGDLPLHEAVKSGRKELVKWLLDQIPSAVNATNSYGRSALHISAINNNTEMCKILIDIGADVNTVMKLKGLFITPLDAALQKGYRGVAKYLLLHGALPASRISHNINKSITQRSTSEQRLIDGFESPIESYDEWKTRTDSTDSALNSHQTQTQSKANDNLKTNLPKLPTLVKNKEQLNESSSSTPFSENGNHFRNVRELETPLNDRPSNLKQAIITNVYVTNTPVVHSKRVPPLKKIKKKKKQLQENEDSKALRVYTPSMSSSSSLYNGDDNNIKVVLETKDILNHISDKELEKIYLNGKGEQILNESGYEIKNNEYIKNTVNYENIENTISNENNYNSIDSQNIEITEEITEISNFVENDNNIDNNSTRVVTNINEEMSIQEIQKSSANESKNSKKDKEMKQKSSAVGTGVHSKHKELKTKPNGVKSKSSSGKSMKTSDKSDDSFKSKNISKQTARKKFSNKLNDFREISAQNESAVKKGEELDNEEISETGVSETGIENTDNRDVDSITYVKSDNESVKSNISSDPKNDKQITDGKDDKNEELIESSKNDLKSNEQSVEKEDINENEEYYHLDQWESDSEKTVIDSDIKHESEDNLNENSVKTNVELKSEEMIEIQTKSKPKVETKTQLKSKSNEKVLKNNKNTTKEKSNEEKSKSIKARNDSKLSNKSTENTNKQNNNKTLQSSDKKVSKFDKTKKINDKNVKTIERNNNFVNKHKSDNKLNSKSNTQRKLTKRSERLSSSDENKSNLSASDMCLSRSELSKDRLTTSALKSAVSNQEINIYETEKPKSVEFSSNESIFDPVLVIETIERTDSETYSSPIDKIISKIESISPLEPIDRNNVTLNRDNPEICNHNCTAGHKSGSRCSHKLHFKTMPANLGKVEVGHISSRVDSRRDTRFLESTTKYSKGRVRRVQRIRPNSDGYQSIDPKFITQTVEKSLRKYQLERKLFEELHDLKRFQIRSGRSNEILMVKRLIDKFRRDVKAPGMTDFSGPYTYKNYELYLYDQLRRLSTSNQGKVALLTRSLSHENIQLVRDTNESITQSNPEFMLNSEGLIDYHYIYDKQNDNTNDESVRQSEIEVNDNKPLVESSFTGDREDVKSDERKAVSELTQSEGQIDFGNERDFNPFSNESERDYTNFEFRPGLDQIVCHYDREPDLTTTFTTTLGQNNEESVEKEFGLIYSKISVPKSTGDINSQISQLNDCQNVDNVCEEVIENDILSEMFAQKDSDKELNECFDDKSDKNLCLDSNSLKNELIVENSNKSLDDVNTNKQLIIEEEIKPITLKSYQSVSDQISDTKSTYGSISLENSVKRSVVSYSSRDRHSKSKSKEIKIKEKKHFKKECLKPVKDMTPLERARNRVAFKRLKTSIPDKHVINISVEDIKNRWKEVKETEMKKVLILSAHMTNDKRKYDFDLWFELNKSFRNKFSSIDYQIIENRSNFQRKRNLSDPLISKHNFNSNYIQIN